MPQEVVSLYKRLILLVDELVNIKGCNMRIVGVRSHRSPLSALFRPVAVSNAALVPSIVASYATATSLSLFVFRRTSVGIRNIQHSHPSSTSDVEGAR
jgi:hypothetical protein